MQWIPVSERLPIEGRAVIITVGIYDYPHGSLVHYMTAHHNCDWGWFFTDGTQVQDKVLAWMPLPEPYEVG